MSHRVTHAHLISCPSAVLIPLNGLFPMVREGLAATRAARFCENEMTFFSRKHLRFGAKKEPLCDADRMRDCGCLATVSASSGAAFANYCDQNVTVENFPRDARLHIQFLIDSTLYRQSQVRHSELNA